MAKVSLVQRDLKRQRMSLRYSARRRALKDIIMKKNQPLEERFQAQLKLSSLPRNGAMTRRRNRCALTGRARGYYRKFRMSRIEFRRLASEGLIPGVLKSSW